MTISDILFALDEHTGAVMAIATIVLAVITAFYALRTQEILKVQRKIAEWTAMPIFRFEDFYLPRGKQERQTWVRFKIETNIAQKMKGRIFLKKENSFSKEITLDTFSPSTAMFGREVTISKVRIDDKIDNLVIGDKFKVQVESKYISLFGRNYKSSHWLIFKKIDDKNNTERILSDMEYEKTPF